MKRELRQVTPLFERGLNFAGAGIVRVQPDRSILLPECQWQRGNSVFQQTSDMTPCDGFYPLQAKIGFGFAVGINQRSVFK